MANYITRGSRATSKYLRTITIRDGYHGHTQPLHLCESPDGRIWGVHSSGYITYADPSRGISPLAPEQSVFGV